MRSFEKRKKIFSFGPTLIVALIVSFILLGYLTYENWVWHECLRDGIPQVDVSRQALVDLNRGCTQYREAIEGETLVDIDRVWMNIDAAVSTFDSLLTEQGDTYNAAPDFSYSAHWTNQLADLRDGIDQYRRKASKLWALSKTGHITPAEISDLDLMARQVHLQAEAYEKAFNHHLLAQMSGQRSSFAVIILLWFAICVLVVYFLFLMIRKHRRIEFSLRQSQQMLQMVLDTIPARVFWKDLNSTFLGCNRLFAGDAGLEDPGQLIGKNDFQMAWREQAELYRSDDKKVMSEGMPKLNYEEPQTGPEQQKLWLRTSKIPLKDLDGKIIGVLGTYEDITERKQAEIELRESMQSSADIVASIPSGLLIFQYHSPDELTLVEANPEGEYLIGVKINEWRGKGLKSVMPAADKIGLTDALLEVMRTGKTYMTENLTYKDSRIDGSFRIRAFRMPGDRLGVALENITERTRAYEALRESEERYRFLYKNMPIMMHSIDSEGCLINVSSQWLAALGYERSEALDKKVTDFLTPESQRHVDQSVFPKLFETGSCQDIQVQFRRKTGEILDVLLSAIAQGGKSGQPVRYHVVLIDVTELKQAESRVSKFFRAVEQSPNSVVISNSEGLIEYVNPRFTEMTGYSPEEVLGKYPRSLNPESLPEEKYKEIDDALESGHTWVGNIQKKRKSGEVYHEKISVSPVTDKNGEITNFLAIAEDVTNEIMIYRKLAESEKLGAIGLLAAGVAHEFKNYLCGIIGSASHALDGIEDNSEMSKARETLSSIINIAEQADGVATSLLTYSKASSDVYQPEDIKTLIDRTLGLIKKEMDVLSINLFTYFENIPRQKVAAGKIQQLFLNLLTNAQQAIHRRGTITTALIQDENSIKIRIGDTGGGISSEIISRIYDPFFSTKGVWGRDYDLGTGMGLAICRNIAREHGGELAVDTVAGVGTIFTISLPMTNDGSEEQVSENPVSPKVVLISADPSVVEKYFQGAQKSRLLFFTARSEFLIEAHNNFGITTILYDASEGDNSLAEIAIACEKLYIPLVVINGRNLKADRNELTGRICAVFDDSPDLVELLGQLKCQVPI
jgi:PAS domain S-box-containing protein